VYGTSIQRDTQCSKSATSGLRIDPIVTCLVKRFPEFSVCALIVQSKHTEHTIFSFFASFFAWEPQSSASSQLGLVGRRAVVPLWYGTRGLAGARIFSPARAFAKKKRSAWVRWALAHLRRSAWSMLTYFTKGVRRPRLPQLRPLIFLCSRGMSLSF